MITFDTNIFCGLTALLSNILLIISVHRKEEGIPALNKETTTTFKGYLAIVILMHHFSQYTTFEGVFSCLKIYKYVGYIAVAIFLFFSGYIFSHNMVGTTNGKLLLKSVARIYLTWVIICCIFAPIILYGGNDFRYFLQYTFLMGLRIQANGIINGCWFIIALIFLYVSHFLFLLLLLFFFLSSFFLCRSSSILILFMFFSLSSEMYVSGLFLKANQSFLLNICVKLIP